MANPLRVWPILLVGERAFYARRYPFGFMVPFWVRWRSGRLRPAMVAWLSAPKEWVMRHYVL